MSEKDKKILETIAEALPKMSEFDKGYFLGTAESKVLEKKKELKLLTKIQDNQCTLKTK